MSSDEPLIRDVPEDAVVMARIEIVRYLSSGGQDLVKWQGVDGSGEDDLSLIEVLGLLEMTKDTAIRQHMGETYETDDEDEADPD